VRGGSVRRQRGLATTVAVPAATRPSHPGF